MNYFFTTRIIKTTLLGILFLSTISYGYAASISIVAGDIALANREPFVVSFLLDAQEDTISGLSGNFSFPTDLFMVSSIRIESSIVSLWASPPVITDERYLDGRTHITFEGIFPGGYDGVSSPYYIGKKSGVLFSVTLIPKNEGRGTFLVDDIALHAFNKDATLIPTDTAIKTVVVPHLVESITHSVSKESRFITSTSLTTFITRDTLVGNNAWYLMVNDREATYAIKKVFVAESNDTTAPSVASLDWREVSVPYILLDQHRTHYVHIKILYSDLSYTLQTLLPVENSTNIWHVSRILLGISIILLLLYMYAKNFFITFTKKYHKEE